MADSINLDDVQPATPTDGRVERRTVDFDTNSFGVEVSYTLRDHRDTLAVDIPASEIIAAASNDQMQACLVELRTVLNQLTRVKVKAALEA